MNRNTIKGIATGFILTAVVGGTLVFAEPVRHNIEAVYNDIKIVIHGEQITPKDGDGNIVNPFIYDGTTYLPIRAVSEALGETVVWDGSTNTVYIGTERPVATPTPTEKPVPTRSPINQINMTESQYNQETINISNRLRQMDMGGGFVNSPGDFDSIPILPFYSNGTTGSTPTSFEKYQSRENITVRYDQVGRPRLKAGDTFIAEDGTAYLLEIGPSGVLGEGLPIATDLGRAYIGDSNIYMKNPVVITDHFRASDSTFGWITSDVSTNGQYYLVLASTGEGHWSVEWNKIQKATRPTHHGTDGETTEHGYWKWSDEVYNEYRYGYGQDEWSAIYEAWVWQVGAYR